MHLLRSPKCSSAGEASVKSTIRRNTADSMCGLVLNSVKEKLLVEARESPQQNRDRCRAIARTNVTDIYSTASVLLSPEYHRAVNDWARHLAYRCASRRAGVGDDVLGRRSSMSTPVVFLEAGSASWGSWMMSPK